MHRFSLALVAALFAASPAFAVDVINRDSTNHRVFICGDGCKPDNTAPNRGVWITLAPGELRTNVCQAACVFIVDDNDNMDPGDLALAAEYSGSDVVAVKAGQIERD
jgi:hypothetical protein